MHKQMLHITFTFKKLEPENILLSETWLTTMAKTTPVNAVFPDEKAQRERRMAGWSTNGTTHYFHNDRCHRQQPLD